MTCSINLHKSINEIKYLKSNMVNKNKVFDKLIRELVSLLRYDMGNSCTAYTQTEREDEYWIEYDICHVSYHCIN